MKAAYKPPDAIPLFLIMATFIEAYQVPGTILLAALVGRIRMVCSKGKGC